MKKRKFHINFLIFLTFKRLGLAVLMILFGWPTWAQTENDSIPAEKNKVNFNHYFQSKIAFGGIVPSVREAGIEHYLGGDLRFGWQRKENTVYSRLYRAPITGVGFYTGRFWTNAYGKPLGFYGFIDVPFRYIDKRFTLHYTLALGMAFNFNYYDPEDNPDNELLGSQRNAYVTGSIEGRYRINERWVTGFGMDIVHFSNGRTQLPNRGVNLVPLVVMIQYNVDENKTDFNTQKPEKFIPYNMVTTFFGAGYKNFEYGEAKYFKSSMGVAYVRHFNYKYRFGGGLELFYTAGSLDRVKSDKSDFNKLFSYGLVGIWEWVITERLYIPLNMGIYFNHNEENYERLIYHRAGARYLLGKDKKLMVGVGLKITELHADYVEWTIGYTFKNDPNKYKLIF